MSARTPRIALLVAALLALPACLRAAPFDGTTSTQAVTFDAPIAAAELELRYDVATARFTGVSSTTGSALVRAFDDGNGHVTVALVAVEDVSGPTLTLHWEASPAAPTPALVSDATYARDGSGAGVGVRLEDTSVTPATSPRGTTLEDVDAEAFLRADEERALTTLASTGDLFGTDLEPGFAHFPLGDLDQSDDVDVLDVLMALDVATGANASPTAYERYHADLAADDDVQIDDVILLLDKAVDPTLPASLVVRPLRLSYVALTQDVPVLVGNAGNQPFSGLAFDGLPGSTSEPIPGQTAVFAPNVNANQAFGTLAVNADGLAGVDVPVGNITILVAGQSNAVGWDGNIPSDMVSPEDWPEVRMLGNDYVWKGAYEPGDDATGQLDNVSVDASAGASPGVELGRQLTYAPAGSPATGRLVYLIPAALGGSGLSAWNSGVPNTERSTLFGSAAYRGLMSAGLRTDPTTSNDFDAEGGPVTAVYWYQGETDSRGNTLRNNFSAFTVAVWDGFRTRLDDSGREPVVIYAQLASHGANTKDDPPPRPDVVSNRQHADVAERQRRLEQGAWLTPTAALDPATAISSQANSHMVVTHDLPRSDWIHLSAEGQRELGQRIALVVREHVLGEAVDGTGPRIVAASRSGNVITIVTDHVITQTSAPGSSGYADYFTVYDGPPNPGDVDVEVYGTNTIAITDVRRDPGNDHAVRITLASSPTVTPYVRYMRPFVDSDTAPRIEDVVRGEASGLPLPAFGPIAVP